MVISTIWLAVALPLGEAASGQPSANHNTPVQPASQPSTVTRGNFTFTVPAGVDVDESRTHDLAVHAAAAPTGEIQISFVVRETVPREIPQGMFMQAMRQRYQSMPKEDVPLMPQAVSVNGFEQVVHMRYKNETGAFTDRWDYWRSEDHGKLKGELEVIYPAGTSQATLEDAAKRGRRLIEAVMSGARRSTGAPASQPSH
jgi:hypothetical protein